jgi:hypothetical protein
MQTCYLLGMRVLWLAMHCQAAFLDPRVGEAGSVSVWLAWPLRFRGRFRWRRRHAENADGNAFIEEVIGF